MRHILTRRNALRGGVAVALLAGQQLHSLGRVAAADTPTRPAAPTDLTAHCAGADASGRPHGVALTWIAVPGATTYNIYRSVRVVPQPAGDTTILHRGVTGTTFTDPEPGLGVDTVPVYQVTAVNAAGESLKSNKAEPTEVEPTVPVAPTHLIAHWAGTDAQGHPDGVVLTWNAVPGATSYNIYRGIVVAPQSDGATTLLHRNVTGTTFTDPEAGLGVDTIPVYQVTAANIAGESAKSDRARPTPPLPPAPAHLTAHWAGTDPNGRFAGVVLHWDAVPGATSYNVYRGTHVIPQPAGDTTLLRRGVTGTTFVNADVTMGVDTVPVYQVTAVTAAGESAKSNRAEPAAPVVEIPVVIQGTVLRTSTSGVLVQTPDRGTVASVTYVVDLSNAVFERADGTPVPAVQLGSGDAVVIAGHRAPPITASGRVPVIIAQVVELAPSR